jgi:anaerobic selenocysteine-containing dehydrogenase
MTIQENEMTNKKSTSDMRNDVIAANLITDEQAGRIAANLLNENAQHLNAVTLQRLLEARGMAVNKLAVSQGVSQSGNVLQMLGNGIGNYFEQHRMLSTVTIVAAMSLTFFVTQRFNVNNNLENSDAFLLASELPPEAFADKGFDTWLVSKRD